MLFRLNFFDIKNNKSSFFFLLFICLVPIFLPFSIFVSDLSLVISCIFFLIEIYKNKNKDIFFNKFSLIFFISYLYLIINSFYSLNTILAFESSLFYFRFYIYSLSIYYCLRKYHLFLSFYFFSILTSFLIVIVDAYIQLFFGFNLIGYEYHNGWKRLSGIFGDEYILGSYLSRIMPLILALFFHPQIKIDKKISKSIVLIILSSILIIFSGERVALLNLIIFLFLFLLFIRISYLKLIIIFLFFLTFTSIIVLSNDITKKRIYDFTLYQIFEGDKINIFSVQHQLIYETAFKIFNDNKLLGIGPKNFRVLCKKYKSYSDLDRSVDGCATSPHNMYVQILVETGIIGFVPFVALFLILFLLIFMRVFKINFLNFNPKNLVHYDLLLIPFFISFFPLNPTGNIFNNWMSIIYYLPLGFLMMYNYNNKNEPFYKS